MNFSRKKFKAAVIGCGKIGSAVGNYQKAVQPGTHGGAFLQHPKTELAALVEPDKNRWEELKKNFSKARLFESAEQMFLEIKPDVVSIAAPTQFHFELVMLAAKNKVPAILCEKPLAYEIDDAEKMIFACKENGSTLFVNHTRHFDPLLQKWAQKAKAGDLGKIYQGSVYYYNGMFNNGTHMVDLLLMFLGDVESVRMFKNEITSNDQQDPNVDGILRFKNGALINLQSLTRNYGYLGFYLLGEKGKLEVENLGYEVNWREKVDNQFFKGFFELSPGKREGKPRSFMGGAINRVIECLDGQAEPVSTGEDGLAVLKVLAAMKTSADQGGKEIFLN